MVIGSIELLVEWVGVLPFMQVSTYFIYAGIGGGGGGAADRDVVGYCFL